MIKFFKIFYITIFILLINTKSFASSEIYEKIDLFSEVLDKVNKDYVDEVDQNAVMDAAINGVLQSLDPYSSYMSPQMLSEMQTETSGKFGGLGIEVGMEAGVVKVISPIDDSPASKAGIKAGDYIVKINNIQVQFHSFIPDAKKKRDDIINLLSKTHKNDWSYYFVWENWSLK